MTRRTVNILLLVERQAARKTLQSVIAELGCEAHFAIDGQQLLDSAAATACALIVIDAAPSTATSLALALALRLRTDARLDQTPILFLTDYVHTADHATDLGADPFSVLLEGASDLAATDFVQSLDPILLKARIGFFSQLYLNKQALLAAQLREVSAVSDVAERTAQLSHQRAFLAAVLDAVEDGIVACDADGALTLFNRATRNLHGLPEYSAPFDEWPQDNYGLYQADGVAPLAMSDIPVFRALAGAHIRNSEMVIARRDGSRSIVLVSGRPLLEENGRKLGAVVSMHDVTLQREVEAAREAMLLEHARRQQAEAAAELVRISEARYRTLTEVSPQTIWLADAAGQVTYCNQHWFDYTGLNAEQTYGRRWTQVIDPDHRAQLKQVWLEAAGSGNRWRIEIALRNADGQLRWHLVQGQPIRDVDGVITQWMGIAIDIHDRRRAELALEESRERSTLLLDSSGEGIYGMAVDSTCSFMNKTGAAMLGYKVEELVGRPIHDVIHHHRADGSAYPLAECKIGRAARTGQALRVDDEVFWSKDGTPIPVDYSVSPMMVAGKHCGAVITFTDVTERRRVEQQLRLSEERERMATEAAGLGLWMWDVAEDRVVWENERMYQILGLQLSDAPINVARFAAGVLHRADAEAFRRAITQTVESCAPFHFIGRFYRRNDNDLRWAEFNGTLQTASDGVTLRMHGSMQDITDRKRPEEALRIREERYRALFDAIDEGFCLIEVLFDAAQKPVDYRFLEVNPAFEKHTGLINPVGKKISELVSQHESHWFDVYGEVALTGRPIRLINEAKALGRWYDTYATRLGDANSRTVAVLFNDISAKKTTDDELRRLADELSETDRRKTEFLATLAHELRNPLAPIRLGLDVMRISADNAQAVARVRSMMERQVAQMVHLVDDLLDVTRISRGTIDLKIERIELKTIIERAVETSLPLIEAGHHRFTLALPEESLLLDADPTRIAQVISNIVNNAAKYTPASGRIELRAWRDVGEVVVAVSDNGIGIAPESLDAVFEMFAQVGRNLDKSQGGLGIGLSLVRRLLELHGGSVSVASAGPGNGSTFTLRLPLANSALANPALPVDVDTLDVIDTNLANANRLRIVVADDNKDAAESLASLLQFAGHKVVLAHDGKQALQAVLQHRPQAAILDIGMPGLDGYQVASAIRDTPDVASMLLIALTGWGAENDLAKSMAAGFNHHLTKPARFAAIEAILSGVVSIAPSTR